MSKILATLTLSLLLLLSASPALAYLDPGSGSGLLGIIIGFFVAIGLTVKTYWYKLKGLFSRKSDTPPSSESETADSSSDQS